MATRSLRRRRNFSDIPRTIALLVWVGFACSLVYYVFDRPLLPQRAVTRPPADHRTTKDDDAIYTGSIILVEPRDRCWLRTIDNRTGSMWDRGYVDCDAVAAATRAPSNQKSGVMSLVRMQSIGQAFRRSGE